MTLSARYVLRYCYPRYPRYFSATISLFMNLVFTTPFMVFYASSEPSEIEPSSGTHLFPPRAMYRFAITVPTQSALQSPPSHLFSAVVPPMIPGSAFSGLRDLSWCCVRRQGPMSNRNKSRSSKTCSYLQICVASLFERREVTGTKYDFALGSTVLDSQRGPL
jgi:hypothetical protein